MCIRDRLIPDGSPSRRSSTNSRRSLANSRSRHRTIFRSAPAIWHARRPDSPNRTFRCATGRSRPAPTATTKPKVRLRESRITAIDKQTSNLQPVVDACEQRNINTKHICKLSIIQDLFSGHISKFLMRSIRHTAGHLLYFIDFLIGDFPC